MVIRTIRCLLLTAIAGMTLLVVRPLLADENEPMGELPLIDPAAEKVEETSRSVQAIIQELGPADAPSRTAAGGDAKTQEAGAAIETEEDRIRRVVKQYLL